MSVAEFSKAMKNKAIQEWLKKEEAAGGSASAAARKEFSQQNINVLINPVSLYRTAEQSSEKTAFLITKDTIKDLLQTVHNVPKGSPDLDTLAEIYFKQFKQRNAGVAVARRQIKLDSGIPAIYFPHIGFDSITNLVNNIMNIPTGELAKYFEKGHIIGLTTELLQETVDRISDIDTTGSFGKSFLIDKLEKVVQYYKRLDSQSANIQPYQNISIYGKFIKRASNRKKGEAKYLVELQPKTVNQGSAKEVQATIGAIRKLFTTANIPEKQILKLIDDLKSKVSDPLFIQDLLQMQSSPSLLKMMEEAIVSTLEGKDYVKQYTGSNVFIAAKQVPRVDVSELKKYAKKQAEQATRAKNALKNVKKKKAPTAPLSLLSLTNLLNSKLHDQIRRNMGTGNSRNTLNYRTGRFANSVRVERITQSREGMITAFYSYMKYPYATFSDGGIQQVPRSRDPKLLISKSIREIAQTMVTNKLRAVNV
jgi:hypothetical protein